MLGVAVLLGVLWLAVTDDARVWPARNTLQYHAVTWWWARTGGPAGVVGGVGGGTLRGVVRDAQGVPLSGGRILVTRWDGTTYQASSGGDGGYAIAGVPEGRYLAVAGAAGYGDVVVGSPWLPWTRVYVPPGGVARVDAVLPRVVTVRTAPGTALGVGDPEGLECAVPLPSRAQRRRIVFGSAGRSNQLTYLYTPSVAVGSAGGAPLGAAAGTTDRWPLLLSVYPGPADGWECASLPLAAAGYAVLAVGPAYGFDLEGDVDELARLLEFARAGAFPGVDGTRVAVLGGSYSALHVQRLLRRREDAGSVRAVVLLGAPSDLFDVRRRFAAGTFVPPFGLDQALIALGFPDREPLRYWRYSGAFHVRPDLPPTALVHSRRDEVVPFQQSEALARRLAEAGAPHELHVFEAASHYLLSEDADSRAIYDLTVGFLARHLTP